MTTDASLKSSSNASPSLTLDLPELPYSIRDHKRAIIIIWTTQIAISCFLPIALIYGLWYGTSLNHTIIFAIITSVFGVGSLYQFWVRMFRLLKKDPKFRPLGSKRGWLDYYQISTAFSVGMTTALLVVGTSSNPVNIRIMSIPPAVLLLFVFSQLLFTFVLSTFNVHTIFRASSIPRGVPIRPGVYTIIEDVIAVDAGVGRAYREALNERYEASVMFRRMLWKINVFWMTGGIVVGAVIIGICYADGVDPLVAYGIGWTVPFGWAGVWAIVTIKWVQADLRKEKQVWTANKSVQEVGC